VVVDVHDRYRAIEPGGVVLGEVPQPAAVSAVDQAKDIVRGEFVPAVNQHGLDAGQEAEIGRKVAIGDERVRLNAIFGQG
jgi:hypothetical protein